jgi:hypothetical protein
MPDIFVAGPSKTNDKTAHHSHNMEELNKHEKTTPQPIMHLPKLTKKSVHLFAAFCENPGDITFKNKHDNETVLLFVRKHFITNFIWVSVSIILLILPLIFGPLAALFNFYLPFLTAKYVLFFTLFYYLFVLSYAFVRFITWYFNVSLVTNERVVDIDFSDVIYKNLASTTLDLVQDVSYTQAGVFRTFFHYGDVEVQTAGEEPHFDFDAVPQPDNVAHIIGGLIGKK